MEANGTPTIFERSSITHVLPAYYVDCVVNFCCIATGMPLNAFTLYIALKCAKGSSASKAKVSVIGMTASYLYGTIGLQVLYTWYLLCLQFDVAMTVTVCSVVRRILGATLLASQFATLIISVDRYLFIICEFEMPVYVLGILFAAIPLYLHGLLNTWQLAFGAIAVEDICGPTLGIPRPGSTILTPVAPVAVFIAFLLNLRIIYFLFRYSKNTKVKKSNGVSSDTKKAMYGLMVQTAVTTALVLPQSIYEALFFIDPTVEFPRTFWLVINGATCVNYSLNPLITIGSIGQYRSTALRVLHIRDEPTKVFLHSAKSRTSYQPTNHVPVTSALGASQ